MTLKIIRQHTQTQAAWVIDSANPESWFAEHIKPAIARYSDQTVLVQSHCGLSKLSTHRYPTDKSYAERVRVLGYIQLSGRNVQTDYISPNYRYTYSSRDKLGYKLPLFAVRSEGGKEEYLAVMHNDHYFEWDKLRYIRNSAALAALVSDLHQHLSQKVLNLQKKNKIRGLQVQAIKAQLQQMANEDNLAYMVDTSERLITVNIRLADRCQLQMSVPFTKFETVLPELRSAIRQLYALYEKGIRFKIQNLAYPPSGWNYPQTPADAANTPQSKDR